MHGGTLGLALLLLLQVIAVPSAAAPVGGPTAVPRTAHAPIVIAGDGDFTPANGVTSGTGTTADPYLIEGWDIVASTGPGVLVENTSLPFVMRNLTVDTVATHLYVITLENVTDGAMTNVSTSGDFARVQIADSDRVTVSACRLGGSDVALLATNSSALVIEDNRVTAGISVLGSLGVVVRHNLWIADTVYGITIADSSGVNVSANAVHGIMNWGVSVETSHDVEVVSNSLWDDNTGIRTESSESVNLTGNSIYGNRLGIDLSNTVRATLSGNRFLNSDALLIEGHSLAAFDSHTITPDNLVDGQPIDYVVGCAPDADLDFRGVSVGEVIVVNCPGVRVSNLHFDNIQVGLLMAYVEAGEVFNNSFTQVWYGAPILRESERVVIHHNFYVDTLGSDDSSANRWNAPYPLGGNWWSYYRGRDECSGPKQDHCPDPDGIGDVPAPAGPWPDSPVDALPLMWPMNRTGAPPIAVLSVSPSRAETGNAVTFDATGSLDPDGQPIQVRWDWQGDGIWDTWWSSDLVAQHTYPAEGTFTVYLAVRDVDGYWTAAFGQVSVVPSPAPVIYLGLIAVVLIVLAVGVAAWSRHTRRRRQGPPEPPNSVR